MSIRQLCYNLDKVLFPIFSDETINNKLWFGLMEELVVENLPRRYQSFVDPVQVVLQYVKWKGKTNV